MWVGATRKGRAPASGRERPPHGGPSPRRATRAFCRTGFSVHTVLVRPPPPAPSCSAQIRSRRALGRGSGRSTPCVPISSLWWRVTGSWPLDIASGPLYIAGPFRGGAWTAPATRAQLGGCATSPVGRTGLRPAGSTSPAEGWRSGATRWQRCEHAVALLIGEGTDESTRTSV